MSRVSWRHKTGLRCHNRARGRYGREGLPAGVPAARNGVGRGGLHVSEGWRDYRSHDHEEGEARLPPVTTPLPVLALAQWSVTQIDPAACFTTDHTHEGILRVGTAENWHQHA